MARLESVPYKIIRDDRVRAFWYEGDVESGRALPESLPAWDPDTPVSVAITADIDVAGGLADVGLDGSEPLVAALVWSSPGSRMRGMGDRAVITASTEGHQSVSLRCDIPGQHLADSVELTLLLALEQMPAEAAPLAPSRCGSRLWSDSRSITLAGEAGRFPMQWVDFEQIALPQNAAWYLDWDPNDLHRGTGNSLCLYLNSKHDGLRAALEAGDPDEKAQLLFDILRFDVGRSMLIGALQNDELIEDRERFDEGTLGDTIGRLIDTLFHDHDRETLMQKAKHDRARFDALVQDRLRLAAAF
ncbi:MAG: hypothetical protein ACR2KQ_03505 [Actinomycetota bacterium]